MVKKDKKKEQKKLAITLVQKRRISKPARGKAQDNSFSYIKDKVMRSELTDKAKREKKRQQQQVRKGRKEAEDRGEDPEALGYFEELLRCFWGNYSILINYITNL